MRYSTRNGIDLVIHWLRNGEASPKMCARVLEECLEAEERYAQDGPTREPHNENQVADEWADDLAAAVVEQGRSI